MQATSVAVCIIWTFLSCVSSYPWPRGRGGGLVYSYGEDDLNRTEDVDDKLYEDEDSRESNSVSIEFITINTYMFSSVS